MITSGTLRRQAQKGIAFRTPGMPGLRPPDEHARQRSDTVRAPVAATPIGTADPLCKTYGKVEAKASSPSYWPAPSRRGEVSAASIFTAWRSPGRLSSVRDRANR